MCDAFASYFVDLLMWSSIFNLKKTFDLYVYPLNLHEYICSIKMVDFKLKYENTRQWKIF